MSVEIRKMAEDVIAEFTKRINAHSSQLKNWGNAFRLYFVDADVAYWIKLSMDGTVEKVEKGGLNLIKKKTALATVNLKAETLKNVFDGVDNIMGAAYGGRIQIEGSSDALMKLAPVFE